MPALASDWSTIATGSQRDIQSVDFSSATHGWLAAAGGDVFATANGGQTWVRRNIGTTDGIMDVEALGQDSAAFATTTGTIVLHLGTEQPKAVRPIANAIFHDIAFLPPKTLVAVGQIGHDGRAVLARSTDCGTTWQELGHGSGNATRTFLKLSFVNRTVGYKLAKSPGGSPGLWTTSVSKTTDGGLTWTGTYYRTEAFEPTGIAAFSADRVVVVGTTPRTEHARYIYSINGGTSWTTKEEQALQKAQAITAVNERLGFAVAMFPVYINGALEDRALVLRTDTYGLEWMSDAAPERDRQHNGIAAAGGSAVIVVGNGGTVLRRTLECEGPEPIRPMPSSISRPIGSSLQLTATALESGVRYLWTKNGARIEGANEPVLQIWRLRAEDAGVYEVTMSNDCGSTVQRCTVGVADVGVLVASEHLIHLEASPVGSSRDTLLRAAFVNEGSAPVTVHTIRLFGGNGQYTVVSETGKQIVQPGSSIDVRIRFTPTAAVASHAVLDVNTGSDIDPSIWIVGIGEANNLPSGYRLHRPIQFGARPVDESTDTVITQLLTNNTSRTIVIRSMQMGGDNAMNFGIVDDVQLPIELLPNRSLAVTVRFVPTYTGTFGAFVALDVEGTTIHLPVTGTGGTIRDAEVVNFGDVAVGQTRDTTLTFHHIYDLGLRVSAINDITGPFQIVETTPALPAVLHGWEYLTVRVRYAPESDGVNVTPMRIYWDEPTTNERFVTQRRVLRGANASGVTTVPEEPLELLVVAPIPATEHIDVRMADGAGLAMVRILDASGRVVREHHADGQPAVRLGTAGLASASYRLLVVTSGGHVATGPLAIVR